LNIFDDEYFDKYFDIGFWGVGGERQWSFGD